MTKIPAFTDIGKTARDLLYGGRSGTYQYNKVLTVSSTTTDGVEFTAVATSKDDKVEPTLKASYKSGKYGFTAAVGAAGKVSLTTSFSNLAPGLSATIMGSVPDQSSGKLGVEYAIPYLTLKSFIGLTSSPKVEVSATTGFEGGVVGADIGYDTSKGTLTRWQLGAAYTAKDYQTALILTDAGETVKFSYAQNVDADTTVGAEVLRSLPKETTAFTLGYCRRLDGGALAKVRLDNNGITSLLYEQELRPKTLLALSSQFDAVHLDKPPKLGVAMNIRH